MSFLSRFLGSDAAEERSVSFQDVWGSGAGAFGAGSKAGKNVTVDTALQSSAVFACIRIITDNIATLPVNAYVRRDGVRAPLSPAPRWLSFDVGPLNKIDITTQIMVSLLTDGNAYVATYRDPLGKVIWMEVLDPKAVEPVVNGATVTYKITNGNGVTGSLTRMDILHIKGLMLPGAVKGVSPIKLHKETIGLSLAATEFGAEFFGNNATPGGLLEVPGTPSEAGIKALKAAWREAHGGTGNSSQLGVLTEGSKFSQISVNPDEAQFLQTRQFQISDIARIYGVPPHLLADASGSTSWGSGLAEQNTMFTQQSLRPWVERIEAAFTWLMTSEGLSEPGFIKFSLDGLLRGSHQQRMDSYVKGIQYGIYTLDEIRAMEDMPPVPDGEGAKHFLPLNLAPIETLGLVIKANSAGVRSLPDEVAKEIPDDLTT